MKYIKPFITLLENRALGTAKEAALNRMFSATLKFFGGDSEEVERTEEGIACSFEYEDETRMLSVPYGASGSISYPTYLSGRIEFTPEFKEYDQEELDFLASIDMLDLGELISEVEVVLNLTVTTKINDWQWSYEHSFVVSFDLVMSGAKPGEDFFTAWSRYLVKNFWTFDLDIEQLIREAELSLAAHLQNNKTGY
jgi:hypothetical protein